MPQRDTIHGVVRQALIKDGWTITDDPYVISYGERFLFVDLAATELGQFNGFQSQFIGASQGNSQIAVEIKSFRGQSAISDLEQAIGQYVLYRLLLNQIDPERRLYLAVGNPDYDQILSEPIGELVIHELPLNLLVVNLETAEVQQWIPPRNTKQS
ncbi:element excision factor XisH family protein [Leptothoe spongobia]|uniref:Fatty-acid synthase n=1 Tax=Leptothoe spongobia TAU-MAC 1115 TaxID=1967444 RepID=A0A947GRM4_9CYAN|nr:element excision factor XisH family protein [Leptothoe spongobia]MBT9317546.1 fatty-acid synthase [Leptothoe spongobia TAU-MAC 1115]